ncbi:MAG: hypothetical protein WDZ29_05460 [Balneolaceae bacterium]
MALRPYIRVGSMDLPEGAIHIAQFYEDRILFRYPSDNPDILKARGQIK